MQKFLKPKQPSTPSRIDKTREPIAKKNPKAPLTETTNKTVQKNETDSISTTEILHKVLNGNDAQHSFNILSKNRPFDANMNKKMTKVEFSDQFSSGSSEFMLLSVDEDVCEAVKNSQSISIRGAPHDDAVLCTETSTYPIKMVESAATHLIMKQVITPPESSETPSFETKIIDGKCFAIGELCPAEDILHLSALKDLLHEHELLWDWQKHENDLINKGCTMTTILNTVQMSLGEIETALHDLPVIKIREQRKYRYLSHNYRGELLKLIIDGLDDGILNIDNVDYDSLRKHFPSVVLDEVIEWYLNARCDCTESTSAFSINKKLLVQDIASSILFNYRKMSRQMFDQLLQKLLPFGMEAKEEYLQGICETIDSPSGQHIVYLSTEDLPDGVRERMTYLFEHRRLWAMDDLRQYFSDIFKSKVAFDKYLVQNCDYTVTANNEMLYCGLRN